MFKKFTFIAKDADINLKKYQVTHDFNFSKSEHRYFRTKKNVFDIKQRNVYKRI